ncbi:glycosyltransferase [Stenotrophomonas tumulicola]|uniref:Glycosyltransferase n=1 Tax=Stenotrophomonas tumulicola TaxID=1685415 RepID=A0A7W3FKM0_9GAMM|nr:glycosyltransferase [Stenotrophomonas tumulicola]MBA8680956.1 glycosyltransferase [Stenotrophomonas tumulicola]
MIAVIVPAHNEADTIARCLESVAVAAAHPRLWGEAVLVVVALDDCSDDTAGVCAGYGVAMVVINDRCVGAARAAAAEHALALGARWIASTDADTTVPSDWLWKQSSCSADAFCGVVDVVEWLDYPQAVQAEFFRREEAEDGHGHIHGANMGFSASAYRAAGGFAMLPTGEDVALVDALMGNDAVIARLAEPKVATSARRVSKAPHGFSSFLRALECEVIGAGTALTPVPMPSR